MFSKEYMSPVWSAAPTPLLENGVLDKESVFRLADHHERLGVKGVFIGGTCGEGPFLDSKTLQELAETTVKATKGRAAIALQITDNSAERMIENIHRYTDTGVDLFVIAPPFMSLAPTQEYLYELYAQVIDASPIPIGLYHRGSSASVAIAPETIAKLAQLPKVVTLKDSACSTKDTQMILAKRDELRTRKDFFAYNGNEFDCVSAATAGYDGMTVGGGCFNAGAVNRIFALAQAGKIQKAKEQQERLNQLMYTIFGGKNITCWLAGEKQFLVELGIFNTCKCIMNYHLTTDCAREIHQLTSDDKNFLLNP